MQSLRTTPCAQRSLSKAGRHSGLPLPAAGKPLCINRLPGTRRSVTIMAQVTSKAGLRTLPGVSADPDPATKGFVFQQTMLRVKDAAKSLDFYTKVLGMRVICNFNFDEAKFSLYFLAYAEESDIPDNAADRVQWMFSRPACLELTHNHGTESDPNFKGYASGNDEPRGFGHIGIAVPDVEAACERFEELGVEFQKRPKDGRMKGLAFIKDPDGYWIEILSPVTSRTLAS